MKMTRQLSPGDANDPAVAFAQMMACITKVSAPHYQHL
jgi:hypothetical protein